MATTTNPRFLNRLRVALDRRLSVANALDVACSSHGDAKLFHLDAPLQYSGFQQTSISCNQLRGFVNRVSNVLVQQAKLKRFERVAIFKSNETDYFFMALAVIRAGGIAVPINWGIGIKELRQYLEYTGAKTVITDRRTFARIGSPDAIPEVTNWVFPEAPEDFGGPAISIDQFYEQASPEFEPVTLARDADVLLVHTSGTTGFPKAVICTNGSVIAGIKGLCLAMPVSRSNGCASAAPSNHFINYQTLLTTMLGALPMWTLCNSDARSSLQLIERERISVYFGFPLSFLRMHLEGLHNFDLSSVRYWINGADAAHEVHIRAFTQAGALVKVSGRPLIKSVFMDGLGSSEVGFPALMRMAFSFSKRFGRYVGRSSLFGPRCKVADENGRSLPAGKVGRFMVQGKTLFKGYWNAHDRLHGVYYDGWWWTGDLVYKDRLGRYYHLDRETDVVQTKQGPLYSLMTEEEVLKHPAVAEASVVGVQHPQDGDVGVAVVYLKPGVAAESEEILSWVNARLKSIAKLRRLIVVTEDGMPVGLTGKVLKRVLRERWANCFVTPPKSMNVTPPPPPRQAFLQQGGSA